MLKLLVANRGAIATRIFRTARKLGIDTVAVFSDEDEQALHTRLADQAVRIGPAPSLESYLRGDRIIEACKLTGANAIHPGYGFLSENATFAEEVHQHGLTFVGPPASAIRALGDKISSKVTARDARVNLIPGHVGEVASDDAALEAAREIGFPIMVKASAGGGGRGMRIAHDEGDLLTAYRLAKEEAINAFGDGRLLFERYFPRSRHVEIQVLGDQHGNYFYMPERECSIQRRHQKVLEESPSPVITNAIRREMGAQALRLAAAAGYYSAGTVEFLVDDNLDFYFLEMNTRLQVEHSVTEDVTGLDLVEQMLKVAAGERLELDQEQLLAGASRRWSMQARICAEDPAADFLPSAGRLTAYSEPAVHGVRLMPGVAHASAIPVYYDSLISKTIACGATREQAISRLGLALDQYVIRGIRHNAPFLRHVLSQEAYQAGDLSTAFVAEHFPDNRSLEPEHFVLRPEEEQQAVCALLLLYVNRLLSQYAPGSAPSSFDLVLSRGEGHNAHQYQVKVEQFDCSHHRPRVVMSVCSQYSDVRHTCALLPPDSHLLTDWNALVQHANIDGIDCWFQVMESGPRSCSIQYKGALRKVFIDAAHNLSVLRFQQAVHTEGASALDVVSPMSGVLAEIMVSVGDVVAAGQTVAFLHAMKMVNEVRTARAGVVASIEAVQGSAVETGDKLMSLEASSASADNDKD